MCTQKMRALSYIGAEKITFPPKPDRHTGRHTYRRTDISVYRVSSLLIRSYLTDSIVPGSRSTKTDLGTYFPKYLALKVYNYICNRFLL